MSRKAIRLLIVVQNLPVPFDRRVWLDCQALVGEGYDVSVVCPKGNGDPSYEVVDTVRRYKYRTYAPGGSKLSKGGCFDELVALQDELKLNGHVEFTGRASDDLLKKVMSTADMGLSPDPKNPLSDLSTRNKTMEYMVFELPVVADDADDQERMGKLGQVRVEEELACSHSARAHLGVYERVAGPAKSGKV